MDITSIAPSASVSPYVAQYVVVRNKEEHGSFFKMVPRSYPVFIFTSPEMETVDNQIGGTVQDFEQGKIYFAGLDLEPALMGIKGNVNFIVVLLPPYCAGLFLREDAYVFTDRKYCITNLNTALRELNEQLWDKNPSVSQQIDLLENYLLKSAEKSTLCLYMVRAISAIHSTKGCIDVKELSRQSYTCDRNLLRMFNQHLGLSPKQYSSMVRFNSFMKDYIEMPEVPIELLATRYNYYDLSHLNKDTLRFLGDCPTRCIAQDQTVNKVLV